MPEIVLQILVGAFTIAGALCFALGLLVLAVYLEEQRRIARLGRCPCLSCGLPYGYKAVKQACAADKARRRERMGQAMREGCRIIVSSVWTVECPHCHGKAGFNPQEERVKGA